MPSLFGLSILSVAGRMNVVAESHIGQDLGCCYLISAYSDVLIRICKTGYYSVGLDTTSQ